MIVAARLLPLLALFFAVQCAILVKGPEKDPLHRFRAVLSQYPVHYSPFSLYRDFSLEAALLHWQRQDFSVNLLDPLRGRLLASGAVRLWERTVQDLAHDLCRTLVSEEVKRMDGSLWHRCIIPATRTVRMRKVQMIANVSQFYDYAPREDEIFAALLAYEAPVLARDREREKEGEKKREGEGEQAVAVAESESGRVCLLGSPAPHLLLSMFASPHVKEVTVFSRQTHSYTQTHSQAHTTQQEDAASSTAPPLVRHALWEQTDMQRAAVAFGRTLRTLSYAALLEEFWKYRRGVDQSEFAHRCDFVHVTPEILPSRSAGRENNNFVESLLPLVRFLAQRQRPRECVSKSTLSSQDTQDVSVSGEGANNNVNNEKDRDIVARIIWQTSPSLSQSEMHRDGPAAREIAWKYRSSWFSQSYFGQERDRNGFFDARYGTWQTKKPFSLSTMFIGYFKSADELRKERESNTVPEVPEDKDFVILMLSASRRQSLEPLFALQSSLAALSYRNVLVQSEMTVQGYEAVERIAKEIGARILHVVFSPLDLQLLGAHTIVVHDLASDRASQSMVRDGEARYQALLSSAMQVWMNEPSSTNTRSFAERFSLPAERVFTVPLVSDPHRLEVLSSLNVSRIADPFFEHSVRAYPQALIALVLGPCSQRQNERVSNLLDKHRRRVRERSQSKDAAKTRSVNLLNFCSLDAADYELDFYLFHAHVVLFPHIDEEGGIENIHTPLIHRALSFGKIAIVESTGTTDANSSLENAAIFVSNIDEMWEETVALADDPEALKVQQIDLVENSFPTLRGIAMSALEDAMEKARVALFTEASN